MPATFYFGNKGLEIPEIKVKKTTFMEERSDILNVIEHEISPIRWIKDILSTDTFLWWNRRDPKPMIRIPSSIKRLFAK